jgi:hypothetical protein
MNPRLDRSVYAIALAFGVLPLWVAHHLPLVDLPQHLHLISVLHRLADPTTLYPRLFETRGQLTPYLGYYYSVSWLSWLVPLDLANKLFLTAYVAGMPLSMAFLLKSLKRPVWPSLLAIPFAYGDSFAWGFINYIAALPLTFLCCGLFVRAINDVPRRRTWAVGLGFCLVGVLLFHVQAFAFLGLALPLLLVSTRAPEDKSLSTWFAARQSALVGVVPGVALFLVWIGGRLGEPSQVEYGAPWKAWGPLLSPQNLSYKPFEQNKADFTQVLANMFHDGSDRWGLGAVAAVALVGLVVGLVPGLREPKQEESWFERFRLLALGLLALGLYFALPFDIRGYMYYLNTRYAHLAAPLLLAAVPVVAEKARRPLLIAAACAAVVVGIPIARGFAAFDDEAKGLDRLAAATPDRPMVMGLIYDASSRVVTHPVYLHASTVIARARGGTTNFSFALTPHSPLKYKGEPPPTFPSEWRPDQLDYARQGRSYDTFVVRGAHPAQVFGALIGTELEIAGQADSFWLVRRR